ncbi:MAG: TetR/AcrR family transcriptional regulator [Hyphomicrobiales bacterium]|nr:MAG: TetR/AcrR family transcriptional regulator [Hyphomicrobiales bacterium]
MGRPSVRQKLVEASLDVFQKTGFNGTSVQDLTDAAGVPKGSFYNHFKSKEELALEALKLYIDRTGLGALLDNEITPLERLRRHFQANWRTVKDRNYTAGCFLGAMSSEISDTHEGAREVFAGVFKAWSNAIAKVIREAQESGAIRTKVDPHSLARFVLNAWQGTLIRMKVSKGEEPYRDFRHAVFEVLLR